LEVDSDKASYQQKLEVLQQQEELIEDEEEQEQKEEEARRVKREAEEQARREEEIRMAESLLPESEVNKVACRICCNSWLTCVTFGSFKQLKLLRKPITG
jgi:septal ring factor EnvC (AmiA/AmiB activator)